MVHRVRLLCPLLYLSTTIDGLFEVILVATYGVLGKGCFPSFLNMWCSLSFLDISIWAAAWQNQQNVCALSEDSDHLGHPPSLISLRCALYRELRTQYLFITHGRLVWVFAVPMNKYWVLISNSSFCWFCRAPTQIFFPIWDNLMLRV